MNAPTILLVEDNPITRKMVRFTLERGGLAVLEAPDAKTALELLGAQAIALVMQDVCLPDMDGFELASRLRRMPNGAEVPILAFSGMLSHSDEARLSSAGFDDVIAKPVEPTRLLQIIRSYLPASVPVTEVPSNLIGKGRRLIIADDDPLQRKLVAFRMQKAGFSVVTAADGLEALEHARMNPPDAVLSDVLMPGLDGFGLCMEIRKDPRLANIPIVLTTNSYVEPTDRDLARRAGAHDLVIRTPELREVMEALCVSLHAEPRPVEPGLIGDVENDRVQRMTRQLERQVTINAGVSQRCALLSAELTVLRGIAEALASHTDIYEALRHTIAACFDAGGISQGVLYLKEGARLRVISFGFPQELTDQHLLEFFGARAMLDAAMSPGQTTQVVRRGATTSLGETLLDNANASSVLLLPIAHKEMAFGALVMLSKNSDMQHEDRVKFGETVAGQISQAIAVAYAFREKERLERSASEQAAILRSVVESIGDGVCVVDAKGELTLWNSAARNLVNMGPKDASLGLASGLAGIFEQDTVTPMSEAQLPLMRAKLGEAHDGVELFVRFDGGAEGVWLSATGRPWRDEQGVARGGVAVFRDVTREKSTQTQLLVSDRMASVGMLAAGVAHEINNPLACVLANLDLACKELSEREAPTYRDELKEMLVDASQAADRVRQIVRDLKVFSRHDDAASGPVDLEKVLESSLRMAWTEIRHRARLVKAYGVVPLVEGSESRLGQVFLNLIVNSVQAIPEGAAEDNRISIETRTDAAGRAVVSISDTGTGISPQNLKRLFMPFHTTKGPGVGTGLGLAISHRIVTSLGGEIQVDSQLGKGTTFRVSLPCARSSLRPQLAAPPLESRAVRRARILVIDDEPMIAGVIARTLSKEHDVTATTSAGQALERLNSGESYDLILCDLMMPQMTGMELHAELCKLYPVQAERVIFLTGGAFTAGARDFLDEVPNQHLEKPFAPQRLRALVNDRIR